MKITATSLHGAVVVETTLHTDHRGVFFRAYCQNELAPIIGARQILQINMSQTRAVGAIRGMHFQHPPRAEMKLIRCTKGRVWDVAVDLRAGSPTYLKWHAQELSAAGATMFVIPEGCAHGFQVLEEDSELLYLHTAPYCPEMDGGVLYDDPRLNILWPLAISQISDRDRQHPAIGPDFQGIQL